MTCPDVSLSLHLNAIILAKAPYILPGLLYNSLVISLCSHFHLTIICFLQNSQSNLFKNINQIMSLPCLKPLVASTAIKSSFFQWFKKLSATWPPWPLPSFLTHYFVTNYTGSFSIPQTSNSSGVSLRATHWLFPPLLMLISGFSSSFNLSLSVLSFEMSLLIT